MTATPSRVVGEARTSIACFGGCDQMFATLAEMFPTLDKCVPPAVLLKLRHA